MVKNLEDVDYDGNLCGSDIWIYGDDLFMYIDVIFGIVINLHELEVVDHVPYDDEDPSW